MNIIKVFTVASFVAMAVPAMAQQTNQEAAEAISNQLTGGAFDYDISDTKSIAINYQFAPLHPGNTVTFSLYTPEPSPLSFTITDSEENTVKTYSPSAKSDYHTGELNISDLPAGQYFYILKWDDKKIKAIPFEKK